MGITVDSPAELAFIGIRYQDQLRLATAREACKEIYETPPSNFDIRYPGYGFVTPIPASKQIARLIKPAVPTFGHWDFLAGKVPKDRRVARKSTSALTAT